MDFIVKKLNYQIDIDKLQEYYEIVKKNYVHLKWTREKFKDQIIDKWKDHEMMNKIYGWAIDSNLEDIDKPCPPFNISNQKKIEFRNTCLSFGYVKELQQIITQGFRWSIIVQEPAGYLKLHSDDFKNYALWISIYSPPESQLVFVYDNKEYPYTFNDLGSIYLLNTSIPHYSYNNSDRDRVTLNVRIKKTDINQNDIIFR
jgi:hypothetical protein